MPLNPEMRASDSDRDRVAESLREHTAQGRITMDELHERLELVYAARTVGDLQQVTADLPEQDLYDLPIPAAKRAGHAPAKRPSGGELYQKGARAAWATWATVSGINFTIWLILAATGNLVYPWWLWVAGPWGAVLLIGTILGPKGGSDTRHS